MYTYQPRGVCSQSIDIDLDGNTIKHVSFVGGCDGNLKAVSKLVEGKTVEEACSILEGLTCGPRQTSCSDQLTKGLRAAQDSGC